MKELMKTIATSLWCHRMVYAGLAAAYGAGCLHVLEKEVVNQIVTGLYCALVLQGDHGGR